MEGLLTKFLIDKTKNAIGLNTDNIKKKKKILVVILKKIYKYFI